MSGIQLSYGSTTVLLRCTPVALKREWNFNLHQDFVHKVTRVIIGGLVELW